MNRQVWGYAAATGACFAWTATVAVGVWSLAGPVVPLRVGLPIVAGAFTAGVLSVPAVAVAGEVLRRRNIPDLRDILSADTAHERAEDHQ